jgi:hypothetical protein
MRNKDPTVATALPDRLLKSNEIKFTLRQCISARATIDPVGCSAHNPGMTTRTKYALLTFGLVNFTLAGVCNAAAYLDPGTGSILFQSAVAAVASGLAVIATARQAVARFFAGLFKRNSGRDTIKN